MTNKPADPEPSLWLQLLILSLIFAIGVSAGWVVWGRNAKSAHGSSPEGGTRRIVLGTGSGGSGPIPSAPRNAASASLNRILQALTIVDPDARLVEFIGAFGEMKAEDALPVQQRLKEEVQPEKGPLREREALFRQWGAVDPQGAIAFAKTLGDEKAQGYVLKLMVEGWARKDSAAAARWLDGWPTAPDWEGVCAGLIKGIASKDPWLASQTAVASIPGECNYLRGIAVPYLAEAMMRRGGIEELKRWFASLPSGNSPERKCKEKAMQTVAHHLDRTDPAQARQWLMAQPVEPWKSDAAYHLVARKWAKDDPAAALTWLAGLAGGAVPVRPAAGKEIFQDWSSEKPDAAAQWAQGVSNTAFLQFIGAVKPPPKNRTGPQKALKDKEKAGMPMRGNQ
jgi:hypothetical protein